MVVLRVLVAMRPGHSVSGERIKAHVRFLVERSPGRPRRRYARRTAHRGIHRGATWRRSALGPPARTGRTFRQCRWSACRRSRYRNSKSSKDGKPVELQVAGRVRRRDAQAAAGRRTSRPRRSSSGTASSTRRRSGTTTKASMSKARLVVLFTNEPQPENPASFKGRTLTYAGRWVYKFEEAARQGALGCLIIHTTPTAGYGWEVVRNSWSKEDPQMLLEPGNSPADVRGLGDAGCRRETARLVRTLRRRAAAGGRLAGFQADSARRQFPWESEVEDPQDREPQCSRRDSRQRSETARTSMCCSARIGIIWASRCR